MLITSIGTADSVTVLGRYENLVQLHLGSSPLSAKVTFTVLPVTLTFLVSYPIKVNCKYLQQLQMIYFPSASAEVPFEVPLTKIDVPGKGCFVLSLTTPETLISCAVSPQKN
jgi:hypothetical protein